MRVSALILGLVGGIIGLLVALVHGVFGLFMGSYAGGHNWYAWLTLGAAVLGIIGGGLALSRPRIAAVLLLIGGLVGFYGSSIFWIVSGVMLLLGSLFAFIGRGHAAHPAPTPQA